MDVAHAILFAKTIDISRVTADYSSAKLEFVTLRYSSSSLNKKVTALVPDVWRLIPKTYRGTDRLSAVPFLCLW